MPRLRFGAFLAPHHPSASIRCCSLGAILISWSTSIGSASTNSGAASTTRAVGR